MEHLTKCSEKHSWYVRLIESIWWIFHFNFYCTFFSDVELVFIISLLNIFLDSSLYHQKPCYCEVGSLLKYICYLFHISHISTHFSCKISFLVLILSSCRAGLIFYRVGVKGINKKTGKDILYFLLIQKIFSQVTVVIVPHLVQQCHAIS